MKGYSFLAGSLLGQRTYLVEKMSLSREEPQVIFAIPAKEHFSGACAILVVYQWRKLRFRWSVVYGPL